MSGDLKALVARAESSPAVVAASADVARLQREMATAQEALGSASRGIQIAKEKVAGTLVSSGSYDVLPLEEAVNKESTARLRVEATEQALSVTWSRLEEAKLSARRDVVPELARRHAESIEELATVVERARDIVLEMRETSSAADTVLGSQSLIRVFTPGWLAVFFHDGKFEVDNAIEFRKAASREIQEMYENLGVKRDRKSASAKPAKSGRLDFLKRVFVP